MNSGNTVFYAAAASLLFAVAAVADVTGHYIAIDDELVTMTIRESPDGAISGSIDDEGDELPLQGQRSGNSFSGWLSAYGERMAIVGSIDGDAILLQLGDDLEDQLVFIRSSALNAASTTPARPALSGTEKVSVNRKVLSKDELDRFEIDYGIRIPPGDFWYDPVLGAWGALGGPTMGQIAPGLPVGGPLPADASGTGTYVFVNGRELHGYDVLALQQITGPIAPGRYFITAEGLSGFEGGPVMWNLPAMAAAAQGNNNGGGAGNNTWQSRITGASGFSDGHTSAVFLPNGGIVSTGD